MGTGTSGRSSALVRNGLVRKLIAASVTLLMTMSLVVAVPFSAAPAVAAELPVAETGDPEKIIAAAVSRFAEQLNQLPSLEALQATIPLSDIRLAEALDLIDRFTALKDQMDALVAGGDVTEAALEAAIAAGSSGPLTLVGDLGAPNGDILPLTINFTIDQSLTIPFSASDGFPITGGSLDATAALTGSFAFELDTGMLNETELDTSFYLLTTPAPVFAASVTASVPALNITDARLGFTDVSLTGSAVYNLETTLTVTDPDTAPPSDGKITFDEFDATAITDLITFAVADTSNDVANITLDIDSPAIPGTPDGEFSFVLPDVGDTPQLSAPNLLGDLPDFQNFTAAEAVGAIERLATLLGGLQTTGRLDVEIPLVGGSLADVFSADSKVLEALEDLIEEVPSDDPGPPPLAPSFDTVQELADLLDDTLDGVSVTYSVAERALLFDLTISDSDSEAVYIGETPPEPVEGGGPAGSCLDGDDNDDDGRIDSEDEDCAAPIFLRFPDLDILNNIEINGGATASLEGEYEFNLTFGLDLTPEPTETGAGQGSCSDGVDNDGDGKIDAAEDEDCDGSLPDTEAARNLEERIFLQVGAQDATVEAIARASFSATDVFAKARIGILDAGIDGASVTLDGPVDPADGEAKALIELDLYDNSPDGRLTMRDLYNTLGVVGAPTNAGIDTAIAADFAATVPVVAAVDGLTLAGGDISLTSNISGDATAVTDLIDDLEIDATSLQASDLFDFSPCANDVDDDGDGVVNDGCPGSGEPANDSPESESTASLTQIIAAIRTFAQNLDGVGDSFLSKPLPLVGRSLGDLIEFSDVLLAVAEDLENPAESDGSLDGGPACANSVDDDGDGVANDGCPTADGVPEGGGIAAGADNSQCLDEVDNDGDGKTNDGCPSVNPTLDRVDELIGDAIQEALNEAVGALAPTVNAALAYVPAAAPTIPGELTFDFGVEASFEKMGSFNADLGGSLGELVGLGAAGDVGIDVTADLDLVFGVDLADLTPFVLDTSGFKITAEAAASDIVLTAGIGPIEFGVGKSGDEASAFLGAQYEVILDDTNSTPERIDFGSLTWPGGTFSGIDQASCDAGDDGCATIPLYLGDTKLGEIGVDVVDLTIPTINVDVPTDVADEITDAIAGELLNFALIESGLGRLVEVVTSFIADGLLAVDIPLIGDDINEIAKFIDGLGNGTDTDGDGTPDTQGLTGIIQTLIAGGDPFEVAAAAETAKGKEQAVSVTVSGATPEVQTITVSDADGGTFTITFDGQTTAGIAHNADGAAVESELEGLSSIGTDNVSVTGGPGGPWTITFAGALRDRNLDEVTVDGSGLTGSSPSIAAATDTEGVGGTFTLAKAGEAASAPIPWDASATELEDALIASGYFTAVTVTPDGPAAWTLSGFTPADPGELVVDDANLDGTATVEVVSAIPTVGDAQDALDDFTEDLKQELFDAGLLLDPSDPTYETPAATVGAGKADLTVVCPSCNDSDPAWKIEGIRFDILLGQVADATGSVDFDFDLGVPGLDLAAKGTPGVEGSWKLELGLVLDKTDGFYIDVGGSSPELLASVEAYLTDPDVAPPPTPSSLEGRIAFVGIDLYDGTVGLADCTSAPQGDPCNPSGETLAPSLVKAQFEVDVVDPGTSAADGKFTFAELTNSPRLSDVFAVKIQAAADINLHLESFIADTGASLPRIYADLQLYWAWAAGSVDDKVTITRDGLAPSGSNEFNFTNSTCADFGQCFSIALNNTNMDAGSFVSSFLAPVLSDIQEFTRPLQPVFDTLNKPIPVLSDLGPEPVTLLSLAKSLGPDDNNYGLIFDLIELITFINNIDTSQDRVIIELGSPNDYELATSRLLNGPIAAEQATDAFSTALPDGNLIDGGGLDRPVTKAGTTAQSPKDLEGIGLTFPFLEEPAKVLGLLFGQDVDLIVWQPKPLSFGFSYSQRFGPIWAVPPVFLEVGGSVSVTGRFGIGYDTQGLREILFEDAGAEALLNGVFLLDRDASGRDVNELEVTGELFANAQVSVVIFSAGAGGSVYATIGIDLQDPNADGKLKFPEIADIVTATGNPFCIFNLNGKFGVRIFVFAEVDLFFWSKRWRKDLADIVLYEFKVECDPNALVEPVLATPTASGAPSGTPSGDVLRLNLGKWKSGRDANGTSIGSGLAEEAFTVTQQPNGSLTVEAFGFSQNYEGPWDAIWADGSGDGADGADTIILLDGGDAAPTTEGDLNAAKTSFTVPAFIVGSGGNDSYILGNGNDSLSAGGGNDTADGRGGDDTLNGDAGNDSLNGSLGNDTLGGGSEDDYLEGGPGGDTLNGGSGDDEIIGGADQGGEDDGIDIIDGGSGSDDIDGGPADDIIDGGPDPDQIQGGDGNDTINGGDENALNCAADGGPGAGDPGARGDVIYGGQGMDTINGGEGDDYLVGGSSIDGSPDEKDIINGNAGCDTIWGDNVEITSTGEVRPQSAGNSTEYGPDQLFGNEGNDLIRGQDGNDDIYGGDGDDDLTGDDGADFMFGDAGTIINRATADVTVTEGAGDGSDTIRGSDGNDHQYGGGAGDFIYGDDGDDVQFGNSGDDVMRGGSDNDEMSGNAGADTMFGDSGNDLMFGDADTVGTGDLADEMRGGLGDDEMFGNAFGDDMRGDAGDDRIVGGSDDAGETDNAPGDPDVIRGGSGNDVMTGDNAEITAATPRIVTLRLDGQGAEDTLFGDADNDRIFGQAGDDDIRGGTGNDYAEGNEGADEIRGEAGDDDLVGGGSAAPDVNNDSVIEANRVGNGLEDTADLIRGGDGSDWIAGDNALLERNFDLGSDEDLVLFDVNSADPLVAGGDDIEGGFGDDVIFGQGGEDDIGGGPDDDYVEGNRESDIIDGGPGDDDLVGGGSAFDGVIDAERTGSGLLDDADVVTGGTGDDWIAGDNARLNRTFDRGSSDDLVLFDVNSANEFIAGGDTLNGGFDNDVIFGQGERDTIFGDDDDDYIEGNHDVDTIDGGPGNDDLIGGGSALDDIEGEVVSVIDADRNGTGLLDEGDTILGQAGVDWIAGDNARLNRVFDRGSADPIVLFDVNSIDGQVPGNVAGGDTLSGGPDDDVIFGQGENDTIDGDADDDYMEGNDGSDLMRGGTGNDDMIGGGSAYDGPGTFTGTFTPDRAGNGLWDTGVVTISPDFALDDIIVGDRMYGGEGIDFIAGDNARINRDGGGSGIGVAPDRSARLFDVALAEGPAIDPDTGRGDFIEGGLGDDVIFGQGNGYQSTEFVDPPDGVDNDRDGFETKKAPKPCTGDKCKPPAYTCHDGKDNNRNGDKDEKDEQCKDAIDNNGGPWIGDTIVGNEGNDYIEGNAGADWIFGNEDNDEIFGGGSANDGVVDVNRDGTTLLDARDIINSGDGNDYVGGDNALFVTPRVSIEYRPVTDPAPVVVALPDDLSELTGVLTEDQFMSSDTITTGVGDDIAVGDDSWFVRPNLEEEPLPEEPKKILGDLVNFHVEVFGGNDIIDVGAGADLVYGDHLTVQVAPMVLDSDESKVEKSHPGGVGELEDTALELQEPPLHQLVLVELNEKHTGVDARRIPGDDKWEVPIVHRLVGDEEIIGGTGADQLLGDDGIVFVSLFRFPGNDTPELGIVPSRLAWDFHNDDDADKLRPGDEELHKRIGNDRFLSKKDGKGDVIFATNGTDEVKKDRKDAIIEEKDGSLNELFARPYMEAFDRLGAPIPDIDFMAPWRRLKGQIFDR